jgi:hypothetical protein
VTSIMPLLTTAAESVLTTSALRPGVDRPAIHQRQRAIAELAGTGDPVVDIGECGEPDPRTSLAGGGAEVVTQAFE